MKRDISPRLQTWTLIEENGPDPKDWKIIEALMGSDIYQVIRPCADRIYGINSHIAVYNDGFNISLGHDLYGFSTNDTRIQESYLLFEGAWERRSKLSSWLHSFNRLWTFDPGVYFVRIDSKK